MKDPKRRIYLDDDGDPERAARDAALRAEAARRVRIEASKLLRAPETIGDDLMAERLAQQRANRLGGRPLRNLSPEDRRKALDTWNTSTGPMLAGLFGPEARPVYPTRGTPFVTLLRRPGPARNTMTASRQKIYDTAPPPFNSIEVREGVRLSIQAGPQNASDPRALLSRMEYEAWELAVFPTGGVWARLGEPFADFWSGPLAGYVPTPDVQDIFDALIDGAPIYDVKIGEQVA